MRQTGCWAVGAAMAIGFSSASCIRDAHSQAREPLPPGPAVVVPPSVPAATPANTLPSPGSRSDVQNVILLSIDSLRADMPWAGYPRMIAPALTAFAARSVRYTNAYSLSSYTSMSVGGFLGGRLPGELRRDGSFFGRYPRDNSFFPERLRAAGVRTIAAHAHFYFRAGYAGFEQGFDRYEIVPGIRTDYTTDLDVTGDRHEAIAERLLSDPSNTSGRFFAWFHFMDPHDRYLPHAGIGPYGRTLRDLYDAEVTWTDRQVGRLLEFIARQPWGARTAVIITADHGEAFGEHGRYRHAFELWQPLVRVPWMVQLPGVPPREITANRSHLDLAPTIMELLGVPAAPEFRGVSLVSELYGAAASERDVWVDLPDTGVSHRRRAMIRGHRKVLAFENDERIEVYDLANDPTESRSLRSTDRPAYDAAVADYRTAERGIQDVAPYARRAPAH